MIASNIVSMSNKDMYKFKPKQDITAYELAILISPQFRVLQNVSDFMTDKELEIIKRHLEKIEK